MMTTATALMSSAAFIMWTMVRSTVFVNIYIYIYEIQKQKNKYTVSLFNVPKIFIASYFMNIQIFERIYNYWLNKLFKETAQK
jgi:TctA family transporter